MKSGFFKVSSQKFFTFPADPKKIRIISIFPFANWDPVK